MDCGVSHGYLGCDRWQQPRKILHCAEEARPGYASCAAHEYEDVEEVLDAKIKLLASMIKQSNNFVAYTGAGISTASGIGDYASRTAAKESKVAGIIAQCGNRWKPQSMLEAQPSEAHRVLVALHKIGHLKWWCQQNHDGLPQKAGMPQHAMNEIHGSWWDPCNPVVKMNENLRSDLFEDLLQWERKADLCLAVGTSLAGMNADRIVLSCAERALEKFTPHEGPCDLTAANLSGSVIVGFQCTRLDNMAALRIYGSIDKVMMALARQMGLNEYCASNDQQPTETVADPEEQEEVGLDEQKHVGMEGSSAASSEPRDVFDIRGYDAETGLRCCHGRLHAHHQCSLEKGTGPGMGTHSSLRLDLREGARVRITSGSRAGSEGTVTRRTREGNYEILFQIRLPPPPPSYRKHTTKPPTQPPQPQPLLNNGDEIHGRSEGGKSTSAPGDTPPSLSKSRDAAAAGGDKSDGTENKSEGQRSGDIFSFILNFSRDMLVHRSTRVTTVTGIMFEEKLDPTKGTIVTKRVGYTEEPAAKTMVARMRSAPMSMMLGRWMVDSALEGHALYLPVVNC